MALRTKAELKALFTTGRVPTQEDYHDLIDSLLHYNEQATAVQQVVDTEIASYDTQLHQRNQNSVTDTLGDVLHLLAPLDPTKNIQPGCPVVPGQVGNDTFLLNLSVIDPAISTPIEKWMVQDYFNSGEYIIKDISFQRRKHSIAIGAGTYEFYADMITSVRIVRAPRVVLQP